LAVSDDATLTSTRTDYVCRNDTLPTSRRHKRPTCGDGSLDELTCTACMDSHLSVNGANMRFIFYEIETLNHTCRSITNMFRLMGHLQYALKTCHPTFTHNFGKCGAISKVLSLLNSPRNFKHCWCNNSHCTL